MLLFIVLLLLLFTVVTFGWRKFSRSIETPPTKRTKYRAKRTSKRSERSLAEVKIFWIDAPSRAPYMLKAVTVAWLGKRDTRERMRKNRWTLLYLRWVCFFFFRYSLSQSYTTMTESWVIPSNENWPTENEKKKRKIPSKYKQDCISTSENVGSFDLLVSQFIAILSCLELLFTYQRRKCDKFSDERLIDFGIGIFPIQK